MKYCYISYDVWGNAKDGFEINAAYATNKFYELEDTFSDYKINRILGVRGIQYEQSNNSFYAFLKKNRKPVFELQPCEG